MDTELKKVLKQCTKDMFKCLTRMDTALLENNVDAYHENLVKLREQAFNCDHEIFKLI